MVAPKSKSKVKKGPWTKDEDKKLLDFIQQHDRQEFSWRTISEKTGLKRCGRSCRMRWTNYLKPGVKRGNFTIEEEDTIIRLHAFIGNKWSLIAAHLPNRSDNEIKNYWRTNIKKRLTLMGIDPVTHMPKNNPSATLSHIVQWEATRVAAEARLARESKLVQRATSPPPPPRCLDVLNVWQSTTLPTSFFESPTSNLNFPCSNNVTVPTVCSIKENDVIVHNEVRGEMGNSHVMGYDIPINHDADMIGTVLGEYDEGNISYWNYLLNLVSSTLEPPSFYDCDHMFQF